MAKNRGARKGSQDNPSPSLSEMDTGRTPQPKKTSKPLEARTDAQAQYINSIRHNRITFGVGPAGVGKTYIAARLAGEALQRREIEKIILTRPAVEAGESIGFLPGEMEEKMAPYIASYKRGFHDQLGGGHFDYLMQKGKIEIVPLAFMQGLSWDAPTMVLFDEAENCTPMQMKMFLTRMGDGARLVIDGDPEQQMFEGPSGLIDGCKRLSTIKKVETVSFGIEDVVRSDFVKEILKVYDDPGAGAYVYIDEQDEDGFYQQPAGFLSGKS